jgi:hypothetical protein
MVLFDLEKDPGERADASAANPGVKEALGSWMSSWARAQLEYYGSEFLQSTEYPPGFQLP